MIEEYTIEKFVEDFEDAQSPDAKQEVLLTLLDSDVDVVEHKELLKEYKEQIQDIREQLNIEADAVINIEIEQGFMKLYTCTKSVGNYIEGSNYYVKIDDVKSKYTESFEGDVPDAIKDYFNSIKPLIWIVSDNGIGTLKYKRLVTDFDFSEHFSNL
jgi:hypothetical protein